MTAFEWFVISQSVVMALATFFLFTLRSGLKAGKLLTLPDDVNRRIALIENEVKNLQSEIEREMQSVSRRFDEANEKMSAYSSARQRILEEVRRDFYPRELANESLREAREQRTEIRQDVAALFREVREVRQIAERRRSQRD